MVAPRGGVHGCSWGGMCGYSQGGTCVVAPGGACVVAPGGHVLLFGGHAWLHRGGVCGFFDEIRSMSRRYASYWNAFLLISPMTFVFFGLCLIRSIYLDYRSFVNRF